MNEKLRKNIIIKAFGILIVFVIFIYLAEIEAFIGYTKYGYLFKAVLGPEPGIKQEVLDTICQKPALTGLKNIVKHTSSGQFYSHELEDIDKESFGWSDISYGPWYYDSEGNYISDCRPPTGWGIDDEEDWPWIKRWQSKQFCKSVLPQLYFTEYPCSLSE